MKSQRNAGGKTENREYDAAMALFDRGGDMARKKDWLFEEMCQEVYGALWDKLTDGERGKLNKACKGVRKIAKPGQVETVADAIRKKWGEDFLTPASIEGNWTRFVGGTAADRRAIADKEEWEAQKLRWQVAVNRVALMDEATFTGFRGRLYHVWHDAPRTSPELCELICELEDGDAG